MTTVAGFGSHLEEMISLVAALVESARRQKDALVAGDLAGIDSTRLEQEELMVRLEKAQSCGRTALTTLKKSLGLGEEETMAGVVTLCPELAGPWRDLLTNLGRLREITVTNRVLAARAVAFYRKVTGILQPDRRADTYAGSGRLRQQSVPVISRVV